MPTSRPPYRLAINGYGRIGRCFLRALHESGFSSIFEVVAVNDPAPLESMAYLTRFDSTHGRFPGTVKASGESLFINGRGIQVFHALKPEAVNWGAMGIDLLVECSGQYGSRDEISRFLSSGVPRILLSNPSNSAADVDATVVFSVNRGQLTGSERIVSNASCTTNAVVPLLYILDEAFGIEQALLTTLHSVMNDQPLIDAYHHTDLSRTRSAMHAIIPVPTKLAKGVERLLPRLSGKVFAKSVRVPSTNVCAIDLALSFREGVDAQKINHLLSQAAKTGYRGQLACSEDVCASIDFNHDPHSAIVDTRQTQTLGAHLANLFIWFDNEWGFANRMLDVARYWLEKQEALCALEN